MTISFHTLGCKLNFAESSAIGKELISRGHQRATQNQSADVCVVNTCSVTDAADHKGRQLINRLRRENPNATIIVTGCYAQLKPQEIAQITGVDYVLGNDEKFQIPQIIDQIESDHLLKRQDTFVKTSPIREINAFHPCISSTDRTRCFLKIQDGCNYFCTYCTIPMARGKSRNATIADTVALAQQAINNGMKEIVLTGVNIGDFGRSTKESFYDLIKALDQLEGEVRYRISSIEPNLLSDEIIDFVAHSRHFAPHFHIPLQSGSDTILKIMKRHYDTALFQERIDHIKSVMPKAFIGVDVMVGLRGETPELFEECRAFVSQLNVSQLHVFTYSERANTRMLDIDYIVPAKERKRRSDILHEISAQKLAAFYAEHKGEPAIVLWEGRVKGTAKVGTEEFDKQEGSKSLMSGFTENYIKLTAPYDKTKINTFERVKI
ncbi:MAG: tRNA (N(6)-L-threonylcarbamoyladenosine(37)-C(2))-methylthiotransferase MtaB [Paludibacteraceae bacterium]|nr:tRNA (N(6)-L-threonylcarbamoyladenosine(37)-C(2))-methylthiotransferase MtaB [Paludibacteraceae bacterium]